MFCTIKLCKCIFHVIRIIYTYTNALNYLNGTTQLHRLLRAQQTRIIRSTRGTSSPFRMARKWIGKVLCSIENPCLTQPIKRLTWIHTLAMVLVSLNSTANHWLLPFVKAGNWSEACIIPTDSPMSNPWSANVTSPGSSCCKIPDFSVKY